MHLNALSLRSFALAKWSPNAARRWIISPALYWQVVNFVLRASLRARWFILESNAVSPQVLDPSSKRAFCSPPLTLKSCTTVAQHSQAATKAEVQRLNCHSAARQSRKRATRTARWASYPYTDDGMCKLQGAVCNGGQDRDRRGQLPGCHENFQIPGEGLLKCHGNRRIEGR